MNFKKVIMLCPIAVIALASCSNIAKRHKIEEYVLSYEQFAKSFKGLDSDGDFNILQLSDIHMGIMDDAKVHYTFIKDTIDMSKKILEKDGRNLHLIAISGDVFTFANKETVKELCAFFEEQKVPWTLTFGNHDEQGYFSIDWMTSYLTELSSQDKSYLIFKDIVGDDVFGNANFVIDLPLYEGHSRQVIMIDSNRYNYGEGYGYDYIHNDQIDWYNRVVDLVDEVREEGIFNDASSIAFFHIPVPEYTDAYKDAFEGKKNSIFIKGKQYVDNYEEFTPVDRNVHDDTSDGAPKVNSGFYDTVQKFNYTKGMFVGHAHTNTNCTDYRPEDSKYDNYVSLCYGVKSTDRIYCDENMLGGQLIHYHATPKGDDEEKELYGSSWFDLDLIYHHYQNKEGK